jgi:hypothetical protein
MGDLLSDDAWAAIELQLPKNQPGAPGVSTIGALSAELCMSSKAGAGGALVPRSTDRAQRSTIALIGGRDGASGSKSWERSLRWGGFMRRSQSTPPI